MNSIRSVLLSTLVVLLAVATGCQQPEGASPSGGGELEVDAGPTMGAASSVRQLSRLGHDLTPLATTDAEWRERLTAEQFEITRRADTERAFSGEYWDNKKDGVYVSVCGGLPLFSSDDKFKSGTGWPSFTRPIDPDHIVEKTDYKLGYARTEILDARSGAHLGHVFDDGPAPTGKRYCLNSAALRFIPRDAELPEESRPVALPGDK